MELQLQVATNATFDEFVSRAVKHFFSSSEEEARANVGAFEENDRGTGITFSRRWSSGSESVR